MDNFIYLLLYGLVWFGTKILWPLLIGLAIFAAFGLFIVICATYPVVMIVLSITLIAWAAGKLVLWK